MITLEQLLAVPETRHYWIRAVCGARKTLRYRATAGVPLTEPELLVMRALNHVHDTLTDEERTRAFQNPKLPTR